MERYRIINGQRYELHHTAAAKGYISRKVTEELEEYTGKYGTGYKVHRPRFDTTNYHYVDYYIKEVAS